MIKIQLNRIILLWPIIFHIIVSQPSSAVNLLCNLQQLTFSGQTSIFPAVKGLGYPNSRSRSYCSRAQRVL